MAVVFGGAAAGPTDAAPPATLETGFLDQAVMASPDRDVWIGRAASVGASRVRVAFNWSSMAPSQPPAAEAASAAWPGYRFAKLDAEVRALVQRGQKPLLNISDAPQWAEGPGRPRRAAAGAWRPNAAAYGAFMQAVAERYSGSFADPLNPGTTLPAVGEYQVWNEPNLDLYLAPQKVDGVPDAPSQFRALVNAGYDGVKRAQPGATVVAGGLAPFGDPGPSPARTRPIEFLRSMFCLDSGLNRTCGNQTRVDVVSLHPYAVDRPGRHARDPDDATVPDFNRVATVVNAGRRAGTLGPALPEYWVTEMSYDSDGPDPDGVPLATRARYISESFWRLWRVGVRAVYWYLMQDQAPEPSYAATYQSGIFYRAGRRKSDARAFRFPLLVTGKSQKRLNVWFRTPTPGTVTVQVRRGGRWVSAAKKRGLPQDGVATVKVSRAGVSAVRGVAGKATSYVWDVK